jgi:RIO kinase 2
VEQGSRNHEVVPTPLIITLSNLKGGNQVLKCISSLSKIGLLSRVRNARYEGYRLTYGGLDYLSLHTHLKTGTIYSVGNQIGVGKESDIIVVASPGGRRLVLKIHRLGRISFRTVKQNRDYLRNRHAGSWMYMSTLAARKEYTFMCALREAGFPVPEPVGWNRHTVVMELVDAFPLRQITDVPDPAKLYGQLMEMILDLSKVGLIHGDFNEFNILIKEEGKETNYDEDEETTPLQDSDVQLTPSASAEETATPTTTERIPSTAIEQPNLIPILIDFPQTLSISHANAEFYFNRDVNCIKTFFERRFHFTSDEPGPFFADAVKGMEDAVRVGGKRLDIEVEATGFNKKLARELEGYMKEVGVDGDANGEAFVDQEGDDITVVDPAEEPHSDNEDQDQVGDPPSSESQTELSDLAVQAPSTIPADTAAQPAKLTAESLKLVDRMSALRTEDSTPTIKGSQKAPTISHAGTSMSRRPPPNPAKVARGWAI